MCLRLKAQSNKVNEPLETITTRYRHTWLNVQHHFHGFLPKRNHGIQSGQVEVIFNEIFCDFTKVLVAGKGTKPTNPRQS